MNLHPIRRHNHHYYLGWQEIVYNVDSENQQFLDRHYPHNILMIHKKTYLLKSQSSSSHLKLLKSMSE